eukprot:TRINITY_DN10729_c0_g1_i1.p1 TRINITY_DN10729_c0_g1~~TRINITY_DN10729_c0_g1_i1.p1  ORF type:complete len:138 (+),score=17.38 TRINITY_DN10729_c0_g1_i1:35-415(+)
MEKDVLKLAARIILLITSKEISKNDLLLMRDPIYALWSDTLDMLEISFVFDEERLIKSWHAAQSVIYDVIFPFLNQTRRQALNELFALFASKPLLVKFYTSPDYQEERNSMRTLLRRAWEKGKQKK